MLAVSILVPRPVKVMAGCCYWVWRREETVLEAVLVTVLSAMTCASRDSHAQSILGYAMAIPDNK
jgi:hypothetical protein